MNIVLIIGFIGITILQIIRFIDTTQYILFITFFAVFWYAWEARRTANEIEYQNSLQVLPFFTMDFILCGDECVDGEWKQLHIINIGKGIALDINFNIYNLISNQVAISHLDNIPVLESDGKQRIFAYMKQGFILGSLDESIIRSNKTPTRYKIEIRFEDIKGMKHTQIIIIEHGQIKPQRVINI